MNLHEYQAKEVLEKYGVPIPRFGVAHSKKEAEEVAARLDLDEAVIKIQVHAGGRGKAGGVKFAKGASEIKEISGQLIGMKMVNQQTGPEGVVASCVLISEPAKIKKEYYMSALIDREAGVPILIASPDGGMDIEEVAEKHPERILKLPFSFDGSFRSYQLLRLAKFMGWKGNVAKEGMQVACSIAKCFIEKDAALLEINPLIQTTDDKIFALDAKLSIDDNALYRHKDLAKMGDMTQISSQEARAKEADLAYIAMHGEIGCMVNGAGLAMATMDIIKLAGSSPANFLDVGGSATKEKVALGFEIILSDSNVKAILINIFGGIMSCATIADGVIEAARSLSIKVPIVVRLEGTHVKEGKALFKESKLLIQTADDLKQAAELVVKAAKNGHLSQ